MKRDWGRYQYDEALAAATSEQTTQEDLDRLARWFQNYDMDDWTGQYFVVDAKTDLKLVPVYKTFEDEDGEIVDEIERWELL